MHIINPYLRTYIDIIESLDQYFVKEVVPYSGLFVLAAYDIKANHYDKDVHVLLEGSIENWNNFLQLCNILIAELSPQYVIHTNSDSPNKIEPPFTAFILNELADHYFSIEIFRKNAQKPNVVITFYLSKSEDDLPDADNEIYEGLAEMAYLTTYANTLESLGIEFHINQADEIPVSMFKEARLIIDDIENTYSLNKLFSTVRFIEWVVHQEIINDASDFGRNLYHMVIGSGKSWFDDHPQLFYPRQRFDDSYSYKDFDLPFRESRMFIIPDDIVAKFFEELDVPVPVPESIDPRVFKTLESLGTSEDNLSYSQLAKHLNLKAGVVRNALLNVIEKLEIE